MPRDEWSLRPGTHPGRWPRRQELWEFREHGRPDRIVRFVCFVMCNLVFCSVQYVLGCSFVGGYRRKCACRMIWHASQTRIRVVFFFLMSLETLQGTATRQPS